MIAEITKWFIDLLIKILTTILDVFHDIFVAAIDALLTAVGALLNSIPAPSFLSQYSLTSLMSGMPDAVMYFAGHLRIGEAFAIVGVGFAFRMGRKLFTLGQW
jgi:hypothetical protein